VINNAINLSPYKENKKNRVWVLKIKFDFEKSRVLHYLSFCYG
jgi:hypothetical protein